MGRGKAKRSRDGGNGKRAPDGQVGAAPSIAAAAAATASPPQRSSVLTRAEAQLQAVQAQVFASAVAVMMRDPRTRDLRVKDLEYLLVPAVAARQCVIARGAMGRGPVIPVGVALWARVSDAVDKRLASGLDKPIALKPDEWQSGQNHWIVLLAGEAKMLPGFLRELLVKDLKGKAVKMRAGTKDGGREVKVLGGVGAPV